MRRCSAHTRFGRPGQPRHREPALGVCAQRHRVAAEWTAGAEEAVPAVRRRDSEVRGKAEGRSVFSEVALDCRASPTVTNAHDRSDMDLPPGSDMEPVLEGRLSGGEHTARRPSP